MGTTAVSSFESTGQALKAILDGAGYLADMSWAALPAVVKAENLKGLEYAEALLTVARTGALAAHDATLDWELDGCGSQTSWLVQETRIDKGEARTRRSWIRRRIEHPLILAAIRDGVLSLSYARKLMPMTGRIPDEAHRREADLILVEAARAGLGLPELIRLAAEILSRTLGPDVDDGQDFDAYTVRLETTLDGAGVLHGELSPECAAALQTVLASLSEKAGPEDNRGRETRMHDALEQACLRLLGTSLLPPRNGRPVQAIVHVGLADLLMLDDGSELQRAWTSKLVARWAGQRAASLAAGGDGAAWLAGPSATGIVCDAVLFPLVTGDPDLSTLDELLKTAVELDRLLHQHDKQTEHKEEEDAHGGPAGQTGQTSQDATATSATATGRATAGDPKPDDSGPDVPPRGRPPQGEQAWDGPAEGGLPQGGSAEGGLAEDGLAEDGLAEGGPAEGGLPEDGLPEGGPAEDGPAQDELAEGGPAQDGPAEGEPAEDGPAWDELGAGGSAEGDAAGADWRDTPEVGGSDELVRWLQDRDVDAARVRELMGQFIGGCVKLLSGEPGLAAYLRRNLFAGTALDGKSLPLDAGDVDDIPWWIRKAVATRDQRCTWPGGCDQPAGASQPHHVIHRFEHGATAVDNLKLLCYFHHHVAVHRWGWGFKANGDGSTEATSPDGRIYRSNSRPPPPRAG